MQCLEGKSPLKLRSYIVGQFSSNTISIVINMKQEMATHRDKVQITRFTHEVFKVIKREFTRYKMGGKFKYL